MVVIKTPVSFTQVYPQIQLDHSSTVQGFSTRVPQARPVQDQIETFHSTNSPAHELDIFIETVPPIIIPDTTDAALDESSEWSIIHGIVALHIVLLFAWILKIVQSKSSWRFRTSV
ncbi:hypothetical protein BDEG_27895 [Batrachochytrium dendrobatidis JEL423]|uniref:Uncharacterized protein n=1 Tax=Batrachochytrium dendrobatidis (strain JEL423) TaxID=403673 RepID=A0A177WXI8_BATDL|nr:hypothetical protein BDEG_27895 [Batrachochytrium dendrobatidis JEL423]